MLRVGEYFIRRSVLYRDASVKKITRDETSRTKRISWDTRIIVIPADKARIAINILECSDIDYIEAFSGEEEATEFATRLSERLINEAAMFILTIKLTFIC